MPEYGLTPKGPNIKRMDVILDELHTALSERWGVNTRQNPQSYINHMLTNFADRLAELWELGLDIYHSEYPSTAQGADLDNAAQFGGSTRALAAPSYYRILCTGIDGTVIPGGTLLASDTNPTTQLVLHGDKSISRSNFQTATIKLTVPDTTSALTVVLNGNPYSFLPEEGSLPLNALKGIAAAIKDDRFTLAVQEKEERLIITEKDVTTNNVMVLSENLTTETVGSVITFATVEDGDILLPSGVVTKIVKSVAGLQSVVNVGAYIAGRLLENDVLFRKSYADKIYNRSSRMLESVKSAILTNVQGIKSVAPYENFTDQVDDMGRWPHSIEVVVDGGDPGEIARQILDTKAGGINTYGAVEVQVPGEYGEDIPVRFNRPTNLMVWFHVAVTMSKTIALPENYADLIKEIILREVNGLAAGMDVVPQRYTFSVAGVDYMDIQLAVTETEERPENYDRRSVTVTPREKATVKEEWIEVVIDG